MGVPIVVIIGPTAVGKTGVAMALQDLLGGAAHSQLISADSAMVYRGLDIGSAKPTAAELAVHPHELIDIREIDAPYTAADFVADADRCVRAARAQNRLPVIVGGTMLYVRRFIDGIADLPQAQPGMRRALEQELRDDGHAVLHERLRNMDPEAAERIHPHNTQRLLRALEVVRVTGAPMSEQWRSAGAATAQQRLGGPVCCFSIEPDDRQGLYQLIEQRFEQMLDQGFMQELQWLHQQCAARQLSHSLPALRSVGYRQGLQHLAGEIDFAAFRGTAITATRRLAKRQLTWLRQWPGLRRLEWGDAQLLAGQIAQQVDLSAG